MNPITKEDLELVGVLGAKEMKSRILLRLYQKKLKIIEITSKDYPIYCLQAIGLIDILIKDIKEIKEF